MINTINNSIQSKKQSALFKVCLIKYAILKLNKLNCAALNNINKCKELVNNYIKINNSNNYKINVINNYNSF